MTSTPRSVTTCVCLSVVLAGGLIARAQGPAAPPVGEWHYYGGDKGFTRYSPLDQIDPENVGDLGLRWRRPKVSARLREAFPEVTAFGGLPVVTSRLV